MAFLIEGQVIVQLKILSEADFSNPAAVYYNSNSLKAQQSPGYVPNLNLSCLCELSSCAFNCFSKQMLIIRANVWRLIDALTEANYSFQQGI